MTSSAKLGIVLALAVSGCAGSHRGSSAASSPVTAVAGCPDHEPTRAPAPVARLLASIDALELAQRDRDHVRVLHAMRALADALEVIAPARKNEILRIRVMSNALERSKSTASAHADFVKIGLFAAANALAALPAQARADRICYRNALTAMTDAAARINPDGTLRDQYPDVRAALRASVAVVYAAIPASRTTTARR
jgi:hypothetical protein